MKLVQAFLPAMLVTVLTSPALADGHKSKSVQPLAAYNIDLSKTSVSGISSGGFMTVQMHAAHADNIVGIGVFAGGPYQCSGNSNQVANVSTAVNICMAGKADAEKSIKRLQDAANQGLIAPVGAQWSDKVWLYSGYNDGVVKQPSMDALETYYSQLVDKGNVYYRDNQNAGHAQIVDNSHGQECVLNGGEFINNCHLDGAGQILEFIYGELNARQTGDLSGQIMAFDQSSWFNGDSNAVMADTAYVYVPEACAQGESCRLHIAFHGCLQSAEFIGDSFYRYAGYNEWADSNNFVVLYPQTTSTGSHFVEGKPFNPKGCWDWWGFTDPTGLHANYATRSSVQIEAIWAMASQLASGFTPVKSTDNSKAEQALTLIANDASDKSIALVWNAEPGVEYQVSMSDGPDGEFTPVNDQPVQSSSYSVTGLNPDTTYYFKLARLDGALPESEVISMQTGSPAAECDPWYGTLSEHIAALRAYRSLLNLNHVLAVGSNDYLGDWSEVSTADATLLKTGPAFYRKANCPDN